MNLIPLTNNPPTLKVGSPLLQYLPDQQFAFCRGTVTAISEAIVTVDFGDMVVEFDPSSIQYAINDRIGEKHFMTIDPGKIVIDFR